MRHERRARGVDRSFLLGLTVYRSVAWVWMAVIALVHRDDMRTGRVWIAVVLLGAALVVSAWTWGELRGEAPRSSAGPLSVVEVAVGSALVTATGWVYGFDHVNGSGAQLGTAWPTAGIIAAGVALGPLAGGVAGALIGGSRALAALAAGGDLGDRSLMVSVVSSMVISSLNGVVAGHVMRLVRRYEREVALSRARDEVARTLHDGVLQTLAVVQRRAGDPALARLARDQEHDLREFLFGAAPPFSGSGPGAPADLAGLLRAVARRFERSFDGTVEVIVAPDLSVLPAATTDAVVGAVGEALTNAGKHGAARRVTVYVEPGEGCSVMCSVNDDGSGFDVATVPDGRGISGSIRARMDDVGGRCEIRSRPGHGTEVLLWGP